MHRQQSLASLLEAVELVLTAGDFTSHNQWSHFVVEIGERLCGFAYPAGEASDGDAALKDFLKVLERTCLSR